MKIICVNNIHYHESGRIYIIKFTVGKSYNTLDDTNNDMYWIINDEGWRQLIDKEYFLTPKEWRIFQLNKLDI